MGNTLDRKNGIDDVPPGMPINQTSVECRLTAVDIREGVRRAHGFALTDDEIARVVSGTIRVADRVLIATADACKPDVLPTLPAAAHLSLDAVAEVRQRALSDANILPEPRVALLEHAAPRGRSIVGLGLVVSVSLASGVFVAGNLLTHDRVASDGQTGAVAQPASPPAERTSDPIEPTVAHMTEAPPAPRLFVGQAEPGTLVEHGTDDVGLRVSGLPTGAVGQPASSLSEMTSDPIEVPSTPEVARPAEVPPAPRLVVGRATSGTSGAVLRLGVSIDHATDDAGLMISGLPVGASLSAGRPLGMDWWYVPAAELPDAMVRPPQDFAGGMDLSVELRGPENTVTERQSVRLEWAHARAAAVPSAPTAATAAEPARSGAAGFTPRKLEPEEIAALRKRGEDFFAHGDVTVARLMFQRAAEAADARAAFALAATYDPLVLGDRGIQGVTPDPAMARSWYERASAFGSPEAPHRLELLASRVH